MVYNMNKMSDISWSDDMADKKGTRISFRLDDVRSFKMALYQNKHKVKDKNNEDRPMNNTDFCILSIDRLLESEQASSGIGAEIEKYETIIIKILTGSTKDDFQSKEEYLEKLKEAVKEIERTVKLR